MITQHTPEEFERLRTIQNEKQRVVSEFVAQNRNDFEVWILFMSTRNNIVSELAKLRKEQFYNNIKDIALGICIVETGVIIGLIIQSIFL